MGVLDSVSVGAIEVRPRQHDVLVDGQKVNLTAGEFEIVMALSEHPGWVFSPDDLSSHQSDGDHSPESITVLVSRLRQKLAAAGVSDAIETVRGYGYRLSATGESRDDGSAEEAGSSRALRNAAWQLTEAIIEVEHAGTVEQQSDAIAALDGARHAIFASMAR